MSARHPRALKSIVVDREYLREERRKAFNAGVKAAALAIQNRALALHKGVYTFEGTSPREAVIEHLLSVETYIGSLRKPAPKKSRRKS